MKTDKHPLLLWLKTQTTPRGGRGRHLSIFRFAIDRGFDHRTLYLMVGWHGEAARLPAFATLKRLEEATAGEVTVLRCINWYERNKGEVDA